MNTPLSWIRAYVPGLECTDQEYNDRMTLSGTKVDGMYRLDKNLEKIVTGKILQITPHPDADKLVVCRVKVTADDGSCVVDPAEIPGLGEDGCVQIVTGAPNVFEGAVVPVVLAGGRVAGGHDGSPNPAEGIQIKEGKLRGVESYGMLCSIEELGSSRDAYPEAPEYGIYIFTEASPEGIPQTGKDAVASLGLHDTVFEYEITSNRVDCYSVIGVAREAAATFGLPFEPPVVELQEENNGKRVEDYVSVEVKDPDLCKRYCARVCTDVKIAPSPQWMQRRLAAAGLRPINNLVDITNYVMLEYGQPMHAFDLDTVAGHKIVVRRAADGETFRTLDGQDRKLDHDVLMICDAEKEIGIAGIMGGDNSKITEDVKTVLFESACFNGPNIRKSAKRIGLRTDASGFFEKGLDPVNSRDAVDRACQLMQELGCGTVVPGCADVCEPLPDPVRIPFCADEINTYLGTNCDEAEMLRIFNKLELGYDEEKKEVVVPSFRQDLKAMCDLSEEVARFTGYDTIPTTLPSSSATVGGLTFAQKIENKARETALKYGFSEAMTYSFESPKIADKLLFAQDAPERRAIRIQNPLGEDFSMMRTTPVNGMLSSLSTNYNRRNKDVRLFEIAAVYLPKQLPLTELPDERRQFTLGMYGTGDFFDLKGAVTAFFKNCGIRGEIEFTAEGAEKPFLHPGRQAQIFCGETLIGYMGEVHPSVCRSYEIGERSYLAVLDLKNVTALSDFEPRYEGIARFPAVSRDIALLVPEGVTAGSIEKIIRGNAGENLESVRLFDIYEGKQIGIGVKSMAYNLVFRNKERTLADEEVNAAMDKVLKSLEEVGLKLRA